jgi:two-component system nitrogen regulation sensor histidine kinase NtrY
MAKKKNYHFAHQVVEALNKNARNLPARLKYFVEEYSLDAIEYYPGLFDDRVLSISKTSQLQSVPELSLEFLEKGITHKLEASTIHQFGEGNLVRVIVPLDKGKGAIVVSSFIPMYLLTKMNDIATAYESFKDLDSLEYPVKSIYMIILVLMTLVIMLCATWFGFTLAKGLAVPLVSLSEASERVSKGIYEPVEILSGSTEINLLVDSFNKMMQDLEISEKEVSEANQSLRDTLDVLDKHNRYIEVILSNVSTGVISINNRGEITTLNREAEKLLGVEYEDVRLGKLKEILGTNYQALVEDLLNDAKKYKAPSIKKDLQLSINGEERSLQVTITFLRDDAKEDLGFVLVLDDLTVLANAQRAAAWREVARRIAHEIKNPLTPIKLAAQRLQRKFGADIEDPAFKDCVDTIVSQTDGLKHLVNEFSNFARLPQVKLAENDLNQVLREIYVLYSSGHREIEFNYQPDENIPRFLFDSEQIKRVFVNLIDNAVAAVESTDSPSLSIRSKFDKAIDSVRIDIEDNGPGIEAKNIQQVFEPYYSTKTQGTGLGLAIVKKIIEDHHGYIRAYRLSPQGTKFVIELPLNKLKA